MGKMSILVAGRTSGLILLVVTSALLYYFMKRAGKGFVEEIRKLPPITAIDEAISRAVEMGTPTFMTYGMAGGFTSDTLVGLSALRYLAKETAEKGCELLVGVGGPRTLPVARENYRTGCIEGGAPELFKDENLHFFTSQQWAYASGVMGLMEREKPAACIFMGYFLVEGIHFGINCRRIGTMSIAGNPGLNMSAFMFITMDYVLFGEELYAAGAYFTGSPVTINTLATEDVIKWALVAIVILGSVLATAGNTMITNLLGL